VGPQTWFGCGPEVGPSDEGRSIRELLVYDNVYGGSANTNDLPANLHRTPGKCLVHLKIARDAPRLLEFAILVWTIPAPVVQIHLAIFGHRIKPSLANDAEHGTEIVKRVAAGIFSISDAIGPRQ
jgi:hypothetical protein